MNAEQLKRLPDALLPWYEAGHRDLPWRKTGEPYHVWLSEIMLQQTRVEAVKGYYARFLETLPTIESLANCDEDVGIALITGSGVMQFICENMDPMDPKNEREFENMMNAIFRWDNSKEILMPYGEFFREMAEQHETDMDYDGVARTYAALLTILYDKGEMPHTDFEFGYSVYDDYSGNASPLASGDEYD